MRLRPGKRVLVFLGGRCEQAFMGAIQFAKKARWRFDTTNVYSRDLPDFTGADGILSAYLLEQKVIEKVAEAGLPWVEIGWGGTEDGIARVWRDDVAIGMAAEHFIDLGFTSFAYYSKSTTLWTTRRREGFSAVLREHDFEHVELNPRNVRDRLPVLPKPLALFAVEDEKGVAVIHRCYELGLDVPIDVAVLGVDDNPEHTELSLVPLSSIDSANMEQGYAAAQLLGELMDGASLPNEPTLISPKEVVTRQSTDVLAVPHPKVAQAMEIMQHGFADKGLTMDAIACAVGITRRQLDSAFSSLLGRTMYSELERIRLVEARHLLMTTDLSVQDVADACGFSNYSHLSRALKARDGLTARKFKREAGGRMTE
jgi:LacI family transcriptional regulator